MSEWISVNDRLPMEPNDTRVFESMAVIATDGDMVCVCEFNAGHGCGTPWAEWSTYTDIPQQRITHWQPLPAPPAK